MEIMKIRYLNFILLLIVTNVFQVEIFSQQDVGKNSQDNIYHVPFLSQNNSIEFSIENGSSISLSNLSIEPSELPKWIHLSPNKHIISNLRNGEERSIRFSFSVDKQAPVKKDQILSFNIVTADGNRWKKEIKISIEQPKEFELFQNFPNPFNPKTTIGFQIPQDGKVKLNIFNLLGQEVATLIEDDLSAGYHEKIWNAEDNASGVYIYQVSITNQSGFHAVDRRKIILIK
jgi:hypothetical protein